MHNKISPIQYASLLFVIFLVVFSLIQVKPASAQGGSAGELINAVNDYRVANGLEAYAVDGGLMSLAQSHSDYQASIATCTHAREDGSGPSAYGISAENIACGRNLSVQDAIYYQWSDGLHSATMLGPTTGLVGAGVSVANGTVYYTLAVKRLSGDFNYVPPASSSLSDSGQSNPVQNLLQVVTSTPNEDGSIAHVVKYGETLTSIAEDYGISLADLLSMNGLDPTTPAIREGQVLLIRLAFTQTPFITATYTPRPPTRTPLPTRTPRPTRTATLPRTPLPTWTNTPEPFIQVPDLEDLGSARSILAYSLIAIGAVGFIIVLITGFFPRGNKPRRE